MLSRFFEPRRLGPPPKADVVATVSGAGCGDVVRMWLRVVSDEVRAARHKVRGCPALVASADYLCESVEGLDLDAAVEMNGERVADALGLVGGKRHCAYLAAAALRRAVWKLVL